MGLGDFLTGGASVSGGEGGISGKNTQSQSATQTISPSAPVTGAVYNFGSRASDIPWTPIIAGAAILGILYMFANRKRG